MSSSKTHILHLIKSLGRGGAEKLIPETVAMHDREKYAFFCLYFHLRPNSLTEELMDLGVPVKYLPPTRFGFPGLVKQVADFVKTHHIAIIHCHLPLAGVLGRCVSLLTGVKVVYTEHNVWERYHPLSRLLNKLTFGWQQVVISVSDEVKSSILSHYRPNKMRPLITTIPNAVNTAAFQRGATERRTIRDQLGMDEETIVVGQVAVFRIQKRLDRWMAVAKKIAEAHPRVHFLLVGDGPERETVNLSMGSGSFESRVHLVGAKQDVLPYLSAMDMYMMTSDFEGLPVAMLEAMSCGLPVLSTHVGGIGGVIHDGVEGFLCPKDDTERLLAGAEMLIAHPLKRDEMGTKARQLVVTQFGIGRMVKSLEEVYDKVQKLS